MRNEYFASNNDLTSPPSSPLPSPPLPSSSLLRPERTTTMITFSCAHDKTDCVYWDVDTLKAYPGYNFTAANGCLTDEQRQELFDTCPRTCLRCPDQEKQVKCEIDNGNDDPNYVDPVFFNNCTDWMYYSCRNYGSNTNFDSEYLASYTNWQVSLVFL